LRNAVAELSWLLSREYPGRASLVLVGNRHGLTERQRIAVRRCACSDSALARRRAAAVDLPSVAGRAVVIDGFNVITTMEAALSGGVLLIGRDGALRDMASMHGSYRKVAETRDAARLIGAVLAEHGAASCHWLLDRPVGNSGRLRALLRDEASTAGWPWTIELVDDPDPLLRTSTDLVASADSGVLDAASHWINLARATVAQLGAPWMLALA
jgi:hypothetical protein